MERIQRQIDELTKQKDELTKQKNELLFIERNKIHKNDYEYISHILHRWCKEALLDHHLVVLVDKIGENYCYYSERQINEGKFVMDFEEAYRKKYSIDNVFDNGNFKILIKDAKLKRRQREEIEETITEFIETGEYVYYEF